MPPFVAALNAGADFRGRYFAEPGRYDEGLHAVGDVRRRGVLALTRGHEQAELTEHFLDGAGAAVIPLDDALGRVAPADEPEVVLGALLAELAGNVDKEAAFGDLHVEGRVGSDGLEHGDALVERGTVVGLMREGARKDGDNPVGVAGGGLDEGDVRGSGRVEGAGEDGNPAGLRHYRYANGLRL